jgi:hypothetical protein
MVKTIIPQSIVKYTQISLLEALSCVLSVIRKLTANWSREKVPLLQVFLLQERQSKTQEEVHNAFQEYLGQYKALRDDCRAHQRGNRA